MDKTQPIDIKALKHLIGSKLDPKIFIDPSSMSTMQQSAKADHFQEVSEDSYCYLIPEEVKISVAI